MRKIGQVDERAKARMLSDVLMSDGIKNDVREDEGAFAIWVHDDANVDAARQVLADFRERPDDPRFRKLASEGKGRRKDTKRLDEAYRRRVRAAQTSLYGAGGRGRLTIALLATSVLVTMAAGMGSNWQAVSVLLLTVQPAGALLPEVRGGEIWRLVTPIFIHGGMLHLFFNGWMWWSFAQHIERRKGVRFFGLLVLASAIASNLAEFGWHYVTAPGQYVFFGGLSGVLYAVFGYSWWKGRIDPLDQIGVPPQTVQILLIWLVVCMTGFVGNIANFAHLGGLLFGVVWAYVDVAWFRFQKRL